jgi:hypothetical protein
MRAEEVAEQIRRAFSAAPYPGDNRLTQGSSLEATQVSNFLKGRRWQDLGVEELALNHESLFFMTPEAIRYYIPAFLIASVRHYDDSDKIPGTLLFFLNPCAMTDSEYASRFRERFDVFDHSERGAITAFLEFLRDMHSEDFPTSTGRDEASQLIELWSK